MIASTLLLFLLGLKSRRQFRFESRSPALVANLNAWTRSAVPYAPHDDTIAYYLERQDPAHLESLPGELVADLIRRRVLAPGRLYGRWLVAIDGTGHLFFRSRHCPHCLTRKSADGSVLYYHHVLEAKLVTPNGFAFSLASEPIENTDPQVTKQDCELKAFFRLVEKLAAQFPRLPLVLLGDALYACAPVFACCEQHHWKFIFTFMEGALPALFHEYETLRDLSPRNRTQSCRDGVPQSLAWVNGLDHQGHRLHAFECREPDRCFVWLTNFEVGQASVITLANQGGRQRWKIENQGFNIQKNHGYELEHAYSANENAARNFYLLLQIAHLIQQLMTKGSLLKDFIQILGSLRNFQRRLAESLRQVVIPSQVWEAAEAGGFQIRFDTS